MIRLWMGGGCVWLLLMGVIIAQEPKADDKLIRVECQGQLRDGIVAVGGETTGTTLRFRGITWELQFKDADGKAFAQSHHKQPVSVIGSLRRVGGVERPARWIVEVAKYAESDPTQKKEGANITQTGTLIRDPKNAQQLFLDTGETACPVKLPVEFTIRPGQKISIRGEVEAPEQPSATQPFFIRATKVDAADRPLH
ncbi:MAG: hypothetical protein SFV23_07890 [Planctomycetaceae bacterium]|nr:hypothetical protein [Planctomycetaceae bacterium]